MLPREVVTDRKKLIFEIIFFENRLPTVLKNMNEFPHVLWKRIILSDFETFNQTLTHDLRSNFYWTIVTENGMEKMTLVFFRSTSSAIRIPHSRSTCSWMNSVFRIRNSTSLKMSSAFVSAIRVFWRQFRLSCSKANLKIVTRAIDITRIAATATFKIAY